MFQSLFIVLKIPLFSISSGPVIKMLQCLFIEFFCFLVLCNQVKKYVCEVVSECVRTGQAEKFAWPRFSLFENPTVFHDSLIGVFHCLFIVLKISLFFYSSYIWIESLETFSYNEIHDRVEK
jgi:hypothetical protein